MENTKIRLVRFKINRKLITHHNTHIYNTHTFTDTDDDIHSHLYLSKLQTNWYVHLY